MCRIVDSSMLGYLGQDSAGNGEFEKKTGKGTEIETEIRTETGTEIETEIGPHMDSDREGEGDRDAGLPTTIEPIPIPQPMLERDSSSHSEGEESEDLVNSGDNFSSGKDSDNEGGAQDIVFNPRDKYDPPFELVMLLSTKEEFRDVVHNHAVKTRRNLKITINDCRRMYPRNYPKRNVVGFRENVVQENRFTVSTSQAYRAKRKALKAIEGIERPDAFTFASDKQKGLIPAFELVFPRAENRFCMKHLDENFKKAGFRGLHSKLHCGMLQKQP
ncbi:hypothetical protein BUALT_Bualt03G0155100 [Buddleja alternifolia]|uniref:Transposase n=1 Tax=Buddleja alternifolia TaxID=168488 RepID=A0AAV6XU07_9LAMI|nr:hypothetical protein BUALT_Bualt03G0155100 [Buddleja alternifolia]